MNHALLLLLAQDGEIEYVRKATRDESKAASIEATLKRLPPVRQSAWKILSGVSNFPKMSARGEVDLTAEYGGSKTRWQDGAAFEDGKVRQLRASAWFYRTVEVDREMSVSMTLEGRSGITMWINGQMEQIYVNTHLLPGNRAGFGYRLRKGINHLLVLHGGATPVYFELSPLGPELMAKLEARLDADFPGSSEQSYYRLETIPIPKDVVLEVGGLGFMPDGALMACTRRGEVWSVDVPAGRWTLFATGLHEPLGLCAGEAGEVFVIQRPELTRLKDTDGDGRADLYETISDGFRTSGGSHEFVFGLARDAEGSFYGSMCALGSSSARYLGWCFKITRSGEFIPWASGFRCPNGVGMGADGELFITDNQGDWVGTGPLFHIVKGGFYGHPTSLRWAPDFKGPATREFLDARRRKPAVQFPHGLMGQSASQPLGDTTGGKFGPFAGQLFVGDQSASTVMRVFLEKVEGEYQGACFPFRRGFQCGSNRLVFAPDGSLYVGQTDRGWGALGGRPFGLQRLVWTGKVPREIQSMKLTPEGFDLHFTQPVDAELAGRPESYSLQHYTYKFHGSYGSPQFEATPVRIERAAISPDRLRVSLKLPETVEGRVYELHVKGLDLLHPDAYYTLNRRVARGDILRTFVRRKLEEKFYCEGASFGDFDRDGKTDVVAGPHWYAGPDFQRRSEIYPPKPFSKKSYSDHFLTFVHDMNGDGWSDVLAVGFPGESAVWYENPRGREGHWTRHLFFQGVENESPTLTQLVGDGAPELVCGHEGRIGWVGLADRKFHPITPKRDYHKFTHGLGVGDVNGDGRMDVLEARGWWEQPGEISGDPEWTFHRAKFGTGGAQMYAVDIDGDGHNDVVTSLAAHGYGLAWFRQVRRDGAIEFEKRLIMGRREEENRYGVKFTQLHAMCVRDMDGDGAPDIVVGKRHLAHIQGDPETDAPAVLYWFRNVRGPDGVEFVPYLIDDDSGVGTQFATEDVTGDGWPDIVVGCKLGVFLFSQQLRKVSREEWERAQPKPLPAREY